MTEVTLTLRGEAPLIMHNPRLADPLDEYARTLKTFTGKRKKTDDDHETIQRIEFEGGLYFDEQIGPYVPGEAIHACLKEGAKLTKRGKEIDRALVVMDEIIPLIYEGPRTIAELYSSQEFKYRKSVGVAQSRTMRTRPKFPTGWTLQAMLFLDTARLDVKELRFISEDAGRYAGLLDRRPMMGRFTAIIENGTSNGA